MKNMARCRAALVVSGLAGLAFYSQIVSAALISPLFAPGLNILADSSAERVLRNGNAVTSGNLMVGDTVESIIRFDSLNGVTIDTTLPAPYELTAYSQLSVVSIVTGGGVGGQDRVVFGSTGNLGAGVMLELYESNSAPQLDFGVSPAVAIAHVQSRTLLAKFGLYDVDDFWVWDALTTDISAVVSSTAQSPFASAWMGISILNTPGALPITANGVLGVDGSLHDIVGSADVFARASGVNSGWLMSDPIHLDFTVPEPTTLALLGLGFVGFVFSRNRR